MKGSLTLGAVVFSLGFNALLFGFLPVMTYLRQNAEEQGTAGATETQVVAVPVVNKKKEKPKSLEPLKPAEKKLAAPGKTIARQRFVMDLGPGGGTGVAAGNAVSQGDLQQVSYEEGEVDEGAVLLTKITITKPKKAEAAGAGGLVRSMWTVGENGQVVDVQFLEVPAGYGFEEVVRAAAASARFKPAKVGGVPVRVKWEQSFKF